MSRQFRHREAYLDNYPKLDEHLKSVFEKLYKEATIEYVKAAAATIPTMTGQARASVAAAAKQLGLSVGQITTKAPRSKKLP